MLDQRVLLHGRKEDLPEPLDSEDDPHGALVLLMAQDVVSCHYHIVGSQEGRREPLSTIRSMVEGY